MNVALAHPIDGGALPDAIDTRSPAEIFAGHCKARAMRVAEGILLLREAVDELQGYARLTGLIDAIGQDEVQRIMSAAFDAARDEADDELNEACEREIMVRAADRVRQWELDDPRDRWRHTGEAPSPASVRNSDISGKPVVTAKPYRTPPHSVIDAFFYVVRTKDAAGIAEWLARHQQDEKYLQKLWEQKCSAK